MTKQPLTPLVLAIAVPALLIAFIIGSIYVPRFFAEKPQYDFLYTNDSYWYGVYDIVDGTIEFASNYRETRPLEDRVPPTIYRYDVRTKTSEALSLADAQELQLTENPKAPDGYEVENRYSGGDIFSAVFGGSSSRYRRSLRKGAVNIPIEVSDLSYQFRFIGWVLPPQ